VYGTFGGDVQNFAYFSNLKTYALEALMEKKCI